MAYTYIITIVQGVCEIASITLSPLYQFHVVFDRLLSCLFLMRFFKPCQWLSYLDVPPRFLCIIYRYIQNLFLKEINRCAYTISRWTPPSLKLHIYSIDVKKILNFSIRIHFHFFNSELGKCKGPREFVSQGKKIKPLQNF